MGLFGRNKKFSPPETPFQHGDRCRIARREPGYLPPWSDHGNGVWIRVCECGKEYYREQREDTRPAAPAECEHRHPGCPGLPRIYWEDGVWKSECSYCKSRQTYVPRERLLDERGELRPMANWTPSPRPFDGASADFARIQRGREAAQRQRKRAEMMDALDLTEDELAAVKAAKR